MDLLGVANGSGDQRLEEAIYGIERRRDSLGIPPL